ncbi:MAG: hypothetical protein M3119_04855 [Verrucomicrobiota bacterium]|nr:hypothetical protein [Verrucomicrobiota bacterium]
MLVVFLLGLVLVREPRIGALEETFLRWLMGHSQNSGGPPVPLTVVEISQEALADTQRDSEAKPGANVGAVSPLEYALFLQSALDFQPTVIAAENILKWRERDKDQEQVFVDQAMRVPKLLLAEELSNNPDPDAPTTEIHGFPNVSGKRGDLVAFSGIGRQPSEDLRLISTHGFTNLPDEISSSIRVPLLFSYRGEVVPSFPLQAIMLWQRIVPSEVQIVLGSHITLPQNRKIPIAADGTLLIDPGITARARRISLNELLLAAQQRETSNTTAFADLRDQIVLARSPASLLSPPDVFAATIASIQSGAYIHRISRIFDLFFLLLVAAGAGFLRKMMRFDLALLGIALSAAYCLVALGTIAQWNLYLPGVVPLAAIWTAVVVAMFSRQKKTLRVTPPSRFRRRSPNSESLRERGK